MRFLAYLAVVLFFIWIAKCRLKYPWIIVVIGIAAFTVYVILRAPGEWVLVQVPVIN